VSHYDTLEVSPQASAETVRAAYRSLIQRFHPDRNPGDDAAGSRAVSITQAYDVLSDEQRRGAYDRQLLAAATRIRGNDALIASGRPQPRPSRGDRASSSWISWPLAAVGLAVVAGAVWLAKSHEEPRAELTAIRRAFAAADVPQSRQQQLYARKEVLLLQDPELRLQSDAEAARERAARTVDLLDAPLVVQSAQFEIVISRMRLVLGTFDTPVLRLRIEKQREFLVQEVTKHLAAAAQIGHIPVADESYLCRVVAAAVNNALSTRPDENYPSTYFESPGRYGVVEVVMPDRYLIRAR
jgi:DnaJ domain